MTNSATTTQRRIRRGLVLLVLIATAALAGACGETHGGEGSSGSHWLVCDDDDECSEAHDGASCGSEGYCVDEDGALIPEPEPGGAGAGGDTSSSGAGGNTSDDAGGPHPDCEGKRCGDFCEPCDPMDPQCSPGLPPFSCTPIGTCVAGIPRCPAP